jgi:DNA invertase Pin-like site-specific DNA recombinase
MTTNEVAAIKKAAQKYERAQAARDAAMAELVAAMRAADTAGVSRNEIQRASGLARQTVYNAVSVKP